MVLDGSAWFRFDPLVGSDGLVVWIQLGVDFDLLEGVGRLDSVGVNSDPLVGSDGGWIGLGVQLV